MGRFSKVVFGRAKLPARCIVYGGAYLAERKEVVRRVFGEWTRLKGTWIRYVYARSAGKEFLVVFNVYGGAVALEVLHVLKDGGTRAAFFIGSMYSKPLPIGALVIPVLSVDRAGLVRVDDPRRIVVKQDPVSTDEIRQALEANDVPYEQAKIVSVPCVLHDIQHVKKFIEKNGDFAGVELEVSTFCHFSRKLGLRAYALLYVSDNERYGIVSGLENVWKARRAGLRTSSKVALDVLAS